MGEQHQWCNVKCFEIFEALRISIFELWQGCYTSLITVLNDYDDNDDDVRVTF